VRLRLIGLERHPAAARESARGGLLALLGDGAELPFRRGAVDLVLCAKVLHHVRGEPARRLLAELDRVASRGVVVADIKRSALAAAAIWLASYPMRFHPATRRDSVISVLRGYTRSELSGMCRAAGVRAEVRSHPGYCLTAAWRPVRGAA
jgi:ubiquinone/menaquinone biosynthesis C-methylase UbiE